MKLTEVWPDGRSLLLAEGVLRARYREGFDRGLLVEPGAVHALERRLKTGGFPAYTETLKTSHGALTRVRVGPFPTREAAEGERAKLKDAGENGMVTPLH